MGNTTLGHSRLGGAIMVVLSTLSACGDGSASDGLNEGRVAAFAAMSDRLGDLFNTGYTGQPGEVPSTGTAEFSGHAGFILDTGATPLTLIGDAAMTADIGTRRL